MLKNFHGLQNETYISLNAISFFGICRNLDKFFTIILDKRR